jgi:hypothetical protein
MSSHWMPFRPRWGEAKKEIGCVKGSSVARQALYKVLKRRGAMVEAGSQNIADERPVREDDAGRCQADAGASPLGDAEVLSHKDEVQLVETPAYDGLRVGTRLDIAGFRPVPSPFRPTALNTDVVYVYAARVGSTGDLEYWLVSHRDMKLHTIWLPMNPIWAPGEDYWAMEEIERTHVDVAEVTIRDNNGPPNQYNNTMPFGGHTRDLTHAPLLPLGNYCGCCA